MTTLFDALQILENKRGAGKAKKTKVKLEIEIEAGIIETRTLLHTIGNFIVAYNNMKAMNGASVSASITHSEVESELFGNPDWEK